MVYTESFLDLIRQESSPPFIISTHKYCDGDGLGAGLALCHALRKKGKTAEFFSLEEIHPKYQFMNKKNILRVYERDKTKLLKDAVFIFVDVNDTRLIQPLYSEIKKIKASVYFIDHHPMIQKNNEDHFFIDSSCSSTAELVYQLLKCLDIALDEDIASHLFASVVFDTNCFRYVKNSAKPFEIAAQLVPHIKNVGKIYEHLFKTMTVDKLGFLSKLGQVEYHCNNRVAFLHIKESEFKKYKTDSTQAYDMIDMIRDIDQIDSTVLIIEKEDGSFKLSLRSRKLDLIPLAHHFDGGGHKHSAGASISSQSFHQIKETVLAYLSKAS